MPQGGFSVEGGLDASGLRFAVAVARFNAHVTGPLHDGCREELLGRGAADADVASIEVPGCFELPIVAKALAQSGRFDAVICIGAVIRGDTAHFEYVAGESAAGITRAGLDTGVPVIFGVLTTENREQAFDRVGGGEGHKGEEAALTAIEMVSLLRGLG